MTARRRDLQRPLGHLLTLHVLEVGEVRGRGADARLGARQDLRALEVVGDLDEAARRENGHVAGRPGRFRPALARADDALAESVGADRRRQRAGHGRDRAVQPELPDDHELANLVGRHLAHRRHQAQRDRQVVVTALLRQVRRRQIDGDALRRRRKAGRDQCAAHALPAFRHRLVRQADDGEGDGPRTDLHLDVDGHRVDALEGYRRHMADQRHLQPDRN